jgi:hypothetical protein
MIKLYNTIKITAINWDGYETEPDFNVSDLINALNADETNLAPYTDDIEKLIETKISVEIVDGNLFGVAYCTVEDDWTDEDTKQLKDYLSGQYSDGWGEGFEQREFAEFDELEEYYDENEEYCEEYVNYYVYASFWQRNGFRIMTEDELKEYIGVK